MKRRTLLLGMLLTALPLPVRANAAPRWHSISKRRLGHAIVYRWSGRALSLPVPEDVRHYRSLALKLTGGPLRLLQVTYLYGLDEHEAHRVDVAAQADAIVPLPTPRQWPVTVAVVSELFADGHRYWHLIGTDDPV